MMSIVKMRTLRRVIRSDKIRNKNVRSVVCTVHKMRLCRLRWFERVRKKDESEALKMKEVEIK